MDTDKALLWQCGKFKLDLSVPKVMGILNVTADSFSDGGDFLNKEAALRQAEQTELTSSISEGSRLARVQTAFPFKRKWIGFCRW